MRLRYRPPSRLLLWIALLGMVQSVLAVPNISLTAPEVSTRYLLPASITLTAMATPSTGTTISKVEFYQGSTLIGTDTSSTYSIIWTPTIAGTYILTAKATDNAGGVTTSAANSVIVSSTNSPPTVSLSNPATNSNYTLPATVTISANASGVEANTPITKVEFYRGSTLIGTDTTSAYSITWTPMAVGTYSLTAKASDSAGGVTTSAANSITVNAGVAPVVYFVHSDHLNTPRQVTNEQNVVVWRNQPLAEPFGNSPPEEDPDGDGVSFTMNLRFPGQYYDKETNTNYNYHRDNYFPNFGRYGQSDPLGLQGGINTYSYVEGTPLSAVDPDGLMGHGAGNGGSVWGELGWTDNEMLKKNVPGTDQFFHCMAACRATKKTGLPDAVRQVLNAKEDYWDYPKGRLGLYGQRKRMSHEEMVKDNDADKAANEYGIQCQPNESCEKRCSPLLDDLPPKYRPFMRKYRDNW